MGLEKYRPFPNLDAYPPVLDFEEQSRLKREGRIEELVNGSLRLVVALIQREYPSHPEDHGDLFTAGAMGLWRACQLWEPDKAPLAPYANTFIRAEVRREFQELYQTIHIPRRKREVVRKKQASGEPMTEAELIIAGALESKEELKDLLDEESPGLDEELVYKENLEIVNAHLDGLPAQEIILIESRVIGNLTWDQTLVLLKQHGFEYSRRHATRLLQRALEKLAKRIRLSPANKT